MTTYQTEQHLANLFRAKFPIMYVETWEESRFLELVKNLAQNSELIKTPRKVYAWSLSKKLYDVNTEEVVEGFVGDINSTIKHFINIEEHAILVLMDIYVFFNNEIIQNNSVVRDLRDCADCLPVNDYCKNIIIVSPSLNIPLELQKDVTVVDFDLPTVDEIKEKLDCIINENLGSDYAGLTEEDKLIFSKTAQGLTMREAENAFSRALVERKKLTRDELDIIMEEKCQVIKKTEILEFIKSNIQIDDIGGLDNLKRWLKKRNNSWSTKAQKDYNLPAPKGVLITGIPGCGKSLTAKAMASMWQLPLLRLDIGKIYNKWLGNSEENIRKVIKIAEAVAPSILWIDEIEKGFGENSSNDETSTRIFGSFLTWLQEKTKPVFVVATANNINKIPPEMLRKGRFDEIFFVDLPTPKERGVIFKLHLNKMLKDSVSENFEVNEEFVNKIVEMTEGFSGAEIEQVIVSAIFEAFYEDRILKVEDLYKAIENTVPLSLLQAEQIKTLREWANTRAIVATSKEDREVINSSITDFKTTRGGRDIDF